MPSNCAAAAGPTRVLIADSNHLHSQLLANAFRRHPEFKVQCCEMDVDSILASVTGTPIDVALLTCGDVSRSGHDLVIVHRVHRAHPRIKQVLLLETPDRDSVINAFRAGARGLFCFAKHPFRLLCKCIESVNRGEIWVSGDDVQYLVDEISRVPSLRVVNALGLNLLTPREEQVVALVADGLSNRGVARELQLSEHTVKKYLFRIFEKVGISSRVELVLYAINHGGTRDAEWIPAAAD